MPDTNPNNPSLPPVDITALVQKHRQEIDRIKALPEEAQTAALVQYNFDTGTMKSMAAALEPKAAQLQQETNRAVKKTMFAAVGSATVAALTAFFTRKRFFESKTARFFYVTLPSVGAWFAGSWFGARILGRKVQENNKAFEIEAQSVFDKALALAIENTQRRTVIPQPDVQETRKSLNGFIGQAAVDLGLLSDAQRGKVLEVQARFLALANTGQRLEVGHGWDDVLDDAKWQQTASAKGIDQTKLDAARKTVAEGKGLAKDQAPSSGDTAVKLGFLPQDAKNALLTAQAAERTLQSLSLAGGNTPAFADVVKDPKWQRIGSAGDAPSLQSAQAVNFLAATLGAASAGMGADIPQDAKDKITNARSALETLSVAAFENAAAQLNAIPAAQTVAARIDAVAKDVADKAGKELNISRAEIQRAVAILKAGLDAAGQYMTQKGTPWPAEEITAKLALAGGGGPESPARGNGRGM